MQWALEVAKESGWAAAWRVPLIVTAVIVPLLLALGIFMFLVAR